MRRRSRHGEGEGREFSAPSCGVRAPVPPFGQGVGAPGNSTGTCPGLRGEPEQGGREPALEPWPGGGASLTLMVFLRDVHPRVFIDH